MTYVDHTRMRRSPHPPRPPCATSPMRRFMAARALRFRRKAKPSCQLMPTIPNA